MSEDERPKVSVAQLDEILTTIAKLHDQVNKLKRRLEGGPNPVKEVLTVFDDRWRACYTVGLVPPVHYEFNRTIDPAHVKRLLKVMDATTLKTRIVRYFNDREPFLVKNRHPFNLFVTRINAYSGGNSTPAAPMELTAEPVPGCAHQPPCGTDHEHTRRRMEDMRHIE